jgi:hypothetical protein
MFELSKTVDRDTGKTVVSVTANGNDCETFILKGKLAKRYVGFSLIIMDLDDSAWWLEKAHSLLQNKEKSDNQDAINIVYEESNDEVGKSLRAYYYSSIITYGKCFAAASGRGIKLEAKDYVDKVFMPCHKKIIDFRNDLVAHAGNAFDSGEVIVAPNPFGPEFHVAPNLWRLDFADDRETDVGFKELIEYVKSNVERTQKKILDRLLVGEARDAVIQRNS